MPHLIKGCGQSTNFMGNINSGADPASLGPIVADNVTALLAYWDSDMVCRFANAAYIDWFGKKPEEMINKITIPEFLGKELFELNLPYILGALRGETQFFEREIPLPSGATKHTVANYFPEKNEQGKVIGFFVHVADVTPVKKLEQELVKSYQVIREQNNRLLNFANIVSHNLRTYAGNMSTVLDLYNTSKSAEEKAEMLGFLENISKGFSSTINHLSEIVDAQNKGNIETQSIKLCEYIDRVLDVLRIQMKDANAIIKNKVNPGIVLSVNPAYLESILLNLLSNAIKYKHPAREPEILLSVNESDLEFCISIADNGRGINLEKHGNNLFGMYKTFHGNPDAKGIGLFITKFQVISMGGRIIAESEENKGSTFKVFIPKTHPKKLDFIAG